MKTLAVFVVVLVFAAASAYPAGYGYGYGYGHKYFDPTGNTVPGHGDENNDQLPDYADTNRDGKADTVAYPYHYGHYYGGFPYNYHGFPYNRVGYHTGYPAGVHY